MSIPAWSRGVVEDCKIGDWERAKDQLERTDLLGEVVARREALIVNDYHAGYPGKKGLPPGHVPISRFMLIPILVENRKTANR